jgi:hypothetical protein
MDFKLAIEGGSGAPASSVLSDGGSAAKLAPAASVPACRKRRLENIDPPRDPGIAIIGVFIGDHPSSRISNWQTAMKAWKMKLSMDTGFQCAGCGEWNQTAVDESAGRSQSYVEDCRVCCKPNVLRIYFDPLEQEFVITTQLE